MVKKSFSLNRIFVKKKVLCLKEFCVKDFMLKKSYVQKIVCPKSFGLLCYVEDALQTPSRKPPDMQRHLPDIL